MTELTSCDRAYVKAMRWSAILASAPFLVAAAVLEIAQLLPPGLIVGAVLLIAAYVVARVPSRRFRALGYSLADERLQVVRGILYRSDTVVPFGRVQHIDVHQGPIERAYGLATLTVHTAGTHNASVSLPGLAHADALAMREAIRTAIGRDTR